VLRQVTAPANLAAALARVRHRLREGGARATTLDRFDKSGGLRALGKALETGSHRPAAPRAFVLAKPRGGERRLEVLAIPDRVAQTAVLQVLSPLLDSAFDDASFGFRPNRSLADAVERVQQLRRRGKLHVVRADVADCFGRIRHDRLLDALADRVADRSLRRLIGRWLRAYGRGGRGLPQGAPLSPLLCNLALTAFDRGIGRGPGHLIRFADDFVILCRSPKEARRELERASRLLGEEGLVMNTAKSKLTSFEQGFEFLGHWFVGGKLLRDALKTPVPQIKRRAEARATKAQRREAAPASRHGGRRRPC